MSSMIHNNFISWDSSNWGRALHYISDNKNGSFKNKKVLEIGGANASLSRWAATDNGNVICSDILAIDQQVKAKNKYLKKGNIEFEIIDALSIPYTNYFDYVIFKSVLGGIGRNNNYDAILTVMKQIKKCLRNNGECLFIENMKSTIFHHLIRKQFGAGKNGWYYPSIRDFVQLSKQFSSAKYRTFGLFGSTGKPFLTSRKMIDKKIDQYVPEKWNYIYAGIYKK